MTPPESLSLLVTGAKGQVGSELQALAAQQYAGWRFLFTDRDTLDICDAAAIAEAFGRFRPDYVLNCAAYTAVDKAESEPEQAQLINAEAPRLLAQACAQQGAKLMQLSTDYVYHGAQNTAFREEDPVNPQSVYAQSKLDGERAAAAACPDTLILRTSWVYSAYGHNFVKTMLRLGRERDSLRVVADQIGAPTYARDLATAMLEIVRKTQEGAAPEGAFGQIYHYSNEGVLSWYDFAWAIFDLCGIKCALHPIESSEYPSPAKRPPFSLMNKAKIRDTYDLQIPYWREALKRCLHEMGELR